MNTRITLSAVLAAGVLFVPALARAQAPIVPNTQKLEAKVESLQSQISALQAQVKQLQAQLRASVPSAVGQTFRFPSIQAPSFQSPSFRSPNGQLLQPRRYSNIPDCQIILLKQAAR